MIETLLPNVIELFPQLLDAIYETIIMVTVSFFFCCIFGLPLGIVLNVTRKDGLYEAPVIYSVSSSIVDLFRSLPTLILITSITPLTRFIMGTTIGIKGAVVPLVIASVPYLARQVELALSTVELGVIEAAKSMGESRFKIITRVVLPESLSSLISSFTITFVSLINFSAIAGAVGGGGLGAFAIVYGYNQFKTDIMVVTVAILLVIVIFVQNTGQKIAKKVKH